MFMVYFHHNQANEIIYIGKSKNEEIRPESHKNKEWGTESKYITYAECENEVDMDLYELYYINLYKPKYNEAKKYKSYPTINLPDLELQSYDELKKQFKKNTKKSKETKLTGIEESPKKRRSSRASRKEEEDRRRRKWTEERNNSQKISFYTGNKPDLFLALGSPVNESFTLDGKTEFGFRNSKFESLPEPAFNLFHYLFTEGTVHKIQKGYLQIEMFYHDYLIAKNLKDTIETEYSIKKMLDQIMHLHFYEFSMDLPIYEIILYEGGIFVTDILPYERINGIITKKICIKFKYEFLSKYFHIQNPFLSEKTSTSIKIEEYLANFCIDNRL